MRDIDDRVAELQIDPVHEHLLRDPRHLPRRAPAGGAPREAPASRWSSAGAWRSCCWRGRRRSAEYRGSDLLGNIAPESQVGGGSLVDRYPLSAYALDYHVDVGVTDLDGVPPMIAQWAAAQLWSLTSFLVKRVIDLFTWAFSLDLLGGSPDGGALGAGRARRSSSLYENVIGAGLDGRRDPARRHLGDLEGARAAPLHRDRRRARASRCCSCWSRCSSSTSPSARSAQASRVDQHAVAGVPVRRQPRLASTTPSRPSARSPTSCSTTLVYRAVGGARVRRAQPLRRHRPHRRGRLPAPVGPHDPAPRRLPRPRAGRAATGTAATRRGSCASRPGRSERNAEYDALRDGELPPDGPPVRRLSGRQGRRAGGRHPAGGRRVPAPDARGGRASSASLGAVALLGFLSLAVILAQVVALVLLGFAPVALVVGIFPGAGHEFFRAWLGKLATAVFIKALYSLVIAIVVAVSAALAARRTRSGSCSPSGCRRSSSGRSSSTASRSPRRLVAATTGGAHGERLPRTSVVQRGAEVATKPVQRARRPHRGRDQRRRAGAPGERARRHRRDAPHEPADAPAPTGAKRRPRPANGHRPRATATRRARRPTRRRRHAVTGRLQRPRPVEPTPQDPRPPANDAPATPAGRPGRRRRERSRRPRPAAQRATPVAPRASRRSRRSRRRARRTRTSAPGPRAARAARRRRPQQEPGERVIDRARMRSTGRSRR